MENDWLLYGLQGMRCVLHKGAKINFPAMETSEAKTQLNRRLNDECLDGCD